MTITLGATVQTTFTTTPAEAGTLVVTAPDGTVSSPAVTGDPGSQSALFSANQSGTWVATWVSPNAGQYVETFDVRTAVLSLDAVKARLNKTGTADDVELTALLDAAEAEYAEWVGPLPGTHVETFARGGVVLLSSSRADSLVSVTDGTGRTLTATLGRAGIVSTTNAGPVTVTYVVGPLPAHHVETIYADVAGLFSSTQRGGGSMAPRFPGESYAADPSDAPRGMPVVLFPRIRALSQRSMVG